VSAASVAIPDAAAGLIALSDDADRADAPNLKSTTKPVAKTPRLSTPGIGADELADLVRSFTEVTERLQSTHTALQSQVGQLQAELAQANEQLRRSRELAALGEMAAGIAHELRNPLGSIALDIELLRDDPPPSECDSLAERRRICERVARSIERLDHIVGDVLRFARDLKPQAVECEASEIVDTAIAACDALLRRGQVRIERVGQAEGVLFVDRNLLTQALTNLVRNAAEAACEAGVSDPTVRVGLRRSRRALPDGRRAEHVIFTVEDNGPGIPRDLCERVFHPFFTTRAEGTGLGLAIVHRIVDAHGGSITVRHQTPSVNGSGGPFKGTPNESRERAALPSHAGGATQEISLSGARFDIAIPVRAGTRLQGRQGRGDGLNEAVRRRIGPLAR
jgi:signal transduction histidine kinase